MNFPKMLFEGIFNILLLVFLAFAVRWSLEFFEFFYKDNLLEFTKGEMKTAMVQ